VEIIKKILCPILEKGGSIERESGEERGRSGKKLEFCGENF
jgi:hypothetical protein